MFCISTARGFSPVNHFTLVLVQVAWTSTRKIDVTHRGNSARVDGIPWNMLTTSCQLWPRLTSLFCWSDQPWSTYRINIKWNWKNMKNHSNQCQKNKTTSSISCGTVCYFAISLLILIFVAAQRNHVGICTMLWAQRCSAGGCRREATWIGTHRKKTSVYWLWFGTIVDLTCRPKVAR